MDTISTVSEAIARFGGTASSARLFGVTPPAVSYWKKVGRFPARLMRRVEYESGQRGFHVDLSLFAIDDAQPTPDVA